MIFREVNSAYGIQMHSLIHVSKFKWSAVLHIYTISWIINWLWSVWTIKEMCGVFCRHPQKSWRKTIPPSGFLEKKCWEGNSSKILSAKMRRQKLWPKFRRYVINWRVKKQVLVNYFILIAVSIILLILYLHLSKFIHYFFYYQGSVELNFMLIYRWERNFLSNLIIPVP